MDNIGEIVNERNEKYNEFLDASIQLGIQNCLPKHFSVLLIAKNFLNQIDKLINMIEPRSEYPMRNSSIVKSIGNFSKT